MRFGPGIGLHHEVGRLRDVARLDHGHLRHTRQPAGILLILRAPAAGIIAEQDDEPAQVA